MAPPRRAHPEQAVRRSGERADHEASVPTYSDSLRRAALAPPFPYASLVGAAENKQLMQTVFAGLANGDGQPFMDALADDVRWTVIGTSPWSGTYQGKRAVMDELMRPLFSQFADQYKARASRIIADEDHVVVEARGMVTTKSGQPYNQTYCYVFRLADGKVRELTEYLDTELVSQALETPTTV
jgi:uncharacterized protein